MVPWFKIDGENERQIAPKNTVNKATQTLGEEYAQKDAVKRVQESQIETLYVSTNSGSKTGLQ
jgi:hypothetical protein